MSNTSNIKSERHKPKYDSDSINKSIRNENFLNDALKSLRGLHFPTYKENIINHVKSTSGGSGMTCGTAVRRGISNVKGYTAWKEMT